MKFFHYLQDLLDKKLTAVGKINLDRFGTSYYQIMILLDKEHVKLVDY
jgi:hypothetical protein